MRVEFNIIITYPNGHKDYNTYRAKNMLMKRLKNLKLIVGMKNKIARSNILKLIGMVQVFTIKKY